MKKKLSILMMAAVLVALAGGCVSTADQRSQFGIPGLEDSVQSKYDRSVPQILEAARTVLAANGELTADNSVNHSLVGKVKDVNVYVRVDEVDVTKPVSQVTVQARTSGGAADIGLAHDLDKQIMLKLVQASN